METPVELEEREQLVGGEEREQLVGGEERPVQVVKEPKQVDALPEREAWGSKLEFLLSCLSFAVGLGNVWRFPYLCYKNGGGAFLIPYFLNLVFTGLPLFFFELSLGQFAQSSPIALWSVIPLFQGIGFSMLLIVIGIGLYYNVIVAWILYYLIEVFLSLPSGQLPWTSCGNSWNTDNCVDINVEANKTGLEAANRTNGTTATEEFFTNKMLELSPGIGQVIHSSQTLTNPQSSDGFDPP